MSDWRVFFVRKISALFLVVLFFLVLPVTACAAPFLGGDSSVTDTFIITTTESENK